MSVPEEIKAEIHKAIDEENQISIAEAEKSGGFAEIKGVAFLDNPIYHLKHKAAKQSKLEKFKSQFKRKPNLNGTLSD